MAGRGAAHERTRRAPLCRAARATRTPVLPANVAAEMAILGAILLNNGHYQEAAGRIEAADFSLDSHRRVFARMGELMSEGAEGRYRDPGGAVAAPQGAVGDRRSRPGSPGLPRVCRGGYRLKTMCAS